MTLHRSLFVALFASLVGVASLPPPAQAAESGAGVEALARMFVGSLKSVLLRDLRSGGAPGEVITCVDAIDADDIRPNVEQMFASALSPEEIRAIDAYMSSPVGRKELEVTLESEGTEEPVLTPEEKALSDAFETSGPAVKLDAAISEAMSASDTPGTVGHRLNELMAACLSR